MSAELPDRLSDLLNLGPASEERMAQVGIHSPADLERIGSLEAYRRLRKKFPGWTSLNALYALEGALLDIRWDQLPPDVLDDLRAAAKRLP